MINVSVDRNWKGILRRGGCVKTRFVANDNLEGSVNYAGLPRYPVEPYVDRLRPHHPSRPYRTLSDR